MLALVAVSLALMNIEHQRMEAFNRLRNPLAYLTLPLQWVVDKPVVFVRWIETSFTTQQTLLIENAQLRARQLLLYAKLQRVLALERENERLRALLRSSAQITARVTVAQLIAVDLAPFIQQIILDKGKQEGVYIGQPVLDAYGVMGQIISTDTFTSRVLLITDSLSAVPVQNNRNGIRAIAIGLGYPGDLELIHVPTTTDFQVGDVLVTSGLGDNYPPGYPVGVVNSVKNLPGEKFLRITVKPEAHVNQSRQVLLVWPSQSSTDPKLSENGKNSTSTQKESME